MSFFINNHHKDSTNPPQNKYSKASKQRTRIQQRPTHFQSSGIVLATTNSRNDTTTLGVYDQLNGFQPLDESLWIFVGNETYAWNENLWEMWEMWEMYESICGEGYVAAIPSGIGCVAAGMQLRRSVAELQRNACYSATLCKAFRRNATMGGLFSFGKIISSMLIGSLFPADAACRVPTVFRDLWGGWCWDAALAGFGFWAQKKGEAESLSLLLRGRLPTLPLSQYHRRGEA